jgi:hypothetical protein
MPYGRDGQAHYRIDQWIPACAGMTNVVHTWAGMTNVVHTWAGMTNVAMLLSDKQLQYFF